MFRLKMSTLGWITQTERGQSRTGREIYSFVEKNNAFLVSISYPEHGFGGMYRIQPVSSGVHD